MRKLLTKLFRRNPYGQSASAVLFMAADLLERDGWQRGKEGPPDPYERAPRCALGALKAAKRLVDGPQEIDHFAAAQYALSRAVFGLGITGWNDRRSTTSEMVVNKLRQVGQTLKEKGQ